MSATRLVLARHGETDANVARMLDSLPPGAPLNELGLGQAAALAERLADEPITAVHASRATRARQTAAPVAAAHGLHVDVVEGVQEVYVGDLEGRSDQPARDHFEVVYGAWWRGDPDARLPGGESARDVAERYLPAVATITADARDTVVLVSHGAAIRLAAAALLGDTARTAYVPNTGLVVLRGDPGAATGWTLEHWDPGPPRRGDVTAGGPPGPEGP
ncbi:MAG: histidine phosphatase family protein [Pseudonocardia sp.]|nr:histidine phosphatase family protein [Pseudonocardia sp.]